MADSLVSVIIPTYNGAAYLAEAIESVIGQSYKKLQIIIVNDGSTDATSKVVKSLLATHPSIEYITQPNLGVAQACANALKRVRGEFVLRLDGDDKLPDDYIEKLLGCLLEAEKTDGKTVYSYCDAHYFGAREGVQAGAPYSYARLVVENYIHVSALVRTAVVREIGYFSESMTYGYEDWDLWVHLAEKGFKGVYCRDTFLYYRQKEGTRNQMATELHKLMIEQVHANHPGVYRRPVNRARVFWWKLSRRLQVMGSR